MKIAVGERGFKLPAPHAGGESDIARTEAATRRFGTRLLRVKEGQCLPAANEPQFRSGPMSAERCEHTAGATDLWRESFAAEKVKAP